MRTAKVTVWPSEGILFPFSSFYCIIYGNRLQTFVDLIVITLMQIVWAVTIVVGLFLLILVEILCLIFYRMSRVVNANLVCRVVMSLDAHHN